MVTDGKLVRTLKATAEMLTILCIVNPTTKSDLRSRDGRRTRLQACSTGALENLETVANCTRSLRTRMSNGFQTGLMPEGWHRRFFVGLSPCKVVI